jgi:hypothetical protein
MRMTALKIIQKPIGMIVVEPAPRLLQPQCKVTTVALMMTLLSRSFMSRYWYLIFTDI